MDFLISHQKFKVKNPKYVQTQMDLALLLLLDSTKNYCNFAKCPTFELLIFPLDKMRNKYVFANFDFKCTYVVQIN